MCKKIILCYTGCKGPLMEYGKLDLKKNEKGNLSDVENDC